MGSEMCIRDSRMMEPAKRDVRMVRGMELYVAPDKNAQALTGYRITG